MILSPMRGRVLGARGVRRSAGALGGVAALVAGGGAGLEDKVGGRGLRGEDGALVQNDEAAIEEFAELDAAAGVGAVVGAGRDLDPAGPEADGVVPGDLARVAAAEHQGEITREIGRASCRERV